MWPVSMFQSTWSWTINLINDESLAVFHPYLHVHKIFCIPVPQITLSSASPGTSGLKNSPLGSLKSPSMLSPMATTSPPATTTTSSPEMDDSPKSDGRGPRIKHVCRKAAVVLGKPVAKFPKSPEITLSALPSGEKVKLWKKDQQEKKGRN